MKNAKKWLSCLLTAAMVMSTTSVMASDFSDGSEIYLEENAADELQDAETEEDISESQTNLEEDEFAGESSEATEDINLEDGDAESESTNENSNSDYDDNVQLFSDGNDDNVEIFASGIDENNVYMGNAQLSSEWSWPTYNHTIKSDWPNYSSGKYHGGTDFPVPLNTSVYSSCDGEVVSVQYLTTSYGKHIKVKANVNGNTVYIRYCHLNDIYVKQGDKISAGQLIGKSGSTGNSTGPHLHYEVRNSADRYNPSLNPRLYLPGTSYKYEKNSDPNPTPTPIPAESHVDVGTNFYAYLINTVTWLHATNEESGNITMRKLKDTSDQIWYFERQGDGSYKITSCKDKRCMEVHNFESANGTNVEMNGWNGNTAQRWFIYGSSGQYKLKAACGNNALDLRGGSQEAIDGSNLNMWEDNGTDAQKFSIWKLDDPNIGATAASASKYGDSDGNNVKLSWNSCNNATGYDIRIFDDREENVVQTFWNVQGTSCLAKLPAGTYHVKVYTLNSKFNVWREGEASSFSCSNNLGSDFYAYLINTATWLHATNDSGNVNVKSLEYTPRQIWHFELQNDCSYKITSAEDDRCMEVHNFESNNGTNVEMNNWNGNTAQKWFIYGSSGEYKLKAACGNNALDMRGGSEGAVDGTNLTCCAR